MTDTDAWGGAMPDAPGRDVGDHVPEGYTPAKGQGGWASAIGAIGDITEASRWLSTSVPDGVQWQRDNLGHTYVVGLIAAIQDVRRELGQVEAYLAREIGRDEATPREGVLPDGRQFTVRKGAVRKAWDHDTWQHDARARVLDEMVGGYSAVDPSTGEDIDLLAVLASVQRVHGAGAPRVTAMKELGLIPDDYCETVPGPWSVQVAGDTPE